MSQTVKIILQEDVDNLGQVGEIVAVKAGYARNFLIPRKKAVVASLGSIRLLEHQKRVADRRKTELRDASMSQAKKMADIQITLTAKVGEQDKLYGSITTKDIATELIRSGFDVTHRAVRIGEAIKTVGMHKVEVRLQAGVMAQVKVWVVAENPPPVAEIDEEEEEEDRRRDRDDDDSDD